MTPKAYLKTKTPKRFW